MKSTAVFLLFGLVAFVAACGECEGGWRSYTNYVRYDGIEMWTADGSLDFSDGLDIYECDKLCQPGGIDDFRGCSEYKWAGYYSESSTPGKPLFVMEGTGGVDGAGGLDGAFYVGASYYSIKCTYFVRNTCGQIFPAR